MVDQFVFVSNLMEHSHLSYTLRWATSETQMMPTELPKPRGSSLLSISANLCLLTSHKEKKE